MTTMVQHAVLEHNGKWPAPTNSDGFRYGQLGVMIWRSEFESEAKLLGYINGYRWGVEYPANGKRPELAGDVEVDIYLDDHSENNGGWLGRNVTVGSRDWSGKITSFRITDQRFKPADTSYLDEVSGNPESNWYTRAELPPVGVECEVYNHTFGKDAGWEKCTLLFSGNFICVYTSESCMERSADVASLKFRPIRTEREKVIEAAVKIYDDKKCFSAESFASELHKTGMLVLPPNKSDTKD